MVFWYFVGTVRIRGLMMRLMVGMPMIRAGYNKWISGINILTYMDPMPIVLFSHTFPP